MEKFSPVFIYNIDMKYETVNNVKLPKIGFGTWKIGGESTADPSSDPASLQALRSALELGYTHFDTAEVYADGHTEELLGAAIREVGVPRESLFITSKVAPEHLKYEQVLHSCEKSLERLGMEYLDLYLIHWPKPRMDLKESFRALNQLVRQGKVRHLGVSNFKLKHLKEAVAQSETALLTNQVPYSVPERTYQTNGVLAYCQANDILLTAYSPVKRCNIKNNPALKRIATARGLSPQQVALAWLTSQERVITIPMSTNSQHQAENLQAGEIALNAEEMAQLG